MIMTREQFLGAFAALLRGPLGAHGACYCDRDAFGCALAGHMGEELQTAAHLILTAEADAHLRPASDPPPGPITREEELRIKHGGSDFKVWDSGEVTHVDEEYNDAQLD